MNFAASEGMRRAGGTEDTNAGRGKRASKYLCSMIIKGADGHEMNVTGQGQGNLNTVLGSLGTASFLGLNAGNVLGGMGWNGNRCGCGCGYGAQDMPISRYEAGMLQELGAKDSKIALLESNIYTDQKLADVYERLNEKINANKAAQDAVNLQQATYNAANTAAIGCMQNQIAQLFGITKLVVPNTSVCPGWGNVTITPEAATAGA